MDFYIEHNGRIWEVINQINLVSKKIVKEVINMDVRYVDGDFQFLYRVSCLIFNKDKTKVLLFNCEGRKIYLLPGGKVSQKEKSLEALKREIKEELGYDNIEYKFLGVSEEFVKDKGFYNQQIDLIYQGIYKDDILENNFKGLEGDWINFEWIDINKLDNYDIHPQSIKQAIKNPDKIYHFVDDLIK